MKKKLLIKGIVIIAIFILLGLGLNPVVNSNKIIEQKQTNDFIINPQLSEKEIGVLNNLLSDKIIKEITIEQIINFLKEILNVDLTLLRKNIVISQGWGYNTNIFKNTKFQIKHELFYLWHYADSSKKDVESKTFIISAQQTDSPRTIELYKGLQTGFMIRPFGLYRFQKDTFPSMSYTLFIGFANYVHVTAEETVEIPIPLT